MEKLPLTNWFGWAEVVGTARFITENTFDNRCFMSEDSIAIIKMLAELTPMQQAFLAKAMQEAEKLQAEINTAEEARARA